MPLSIIISYYKKPQNLRVILAALKLQTDKDFDVIISEDDNAEETIEIIKDFIQELNIKHVFHEDAGFRKNTILNESIKKSESEILVFIDGDCIPNKNFVLQYKKNMKLNTFLIGRRVMLSEKISKKILSSGGNYKLTLLNLLLSGSKRIEEAVYLPFVKQRVSKRKLCGCNWAVNRADIIDINGFDEDYTNPGVGEDVDIEWRLLTKGNKQFSIRNRAYVYHLFHKRSYSEAKVQENYMILESKKKEQKIYCENGLKKTS